MQITVLIIEHRHGTDVTAYATPELAQDALEEYVREWWDESGPGKWEDSPLPDQLTDDDIRLYFETAEEGFTIDAEVVVYGVQP